MSRLLFIVTRDDPRLYESLRREFADEPDVEVILDRRNGSPPLRPGDERRRHPEIDERLYALGWVIVHRDRG